jgi:hypothetical protein
MNRRRFLTGTAIGTAGLALAACANLKGLTAQGIAQQVVADAELVANGLAAVVPNLAGVPAALVTVIENVAKDAVQAANDLSATMTATAAQPLVQRIEADVQVVVKDVAGFVSNVKVSQIISDIETLLPLVMTAVGLVVPAALAKASSPEDIAAARARLAQLPKAAL